MGIILFASQYSTAASLKDVQEQIKSYAHLQRSITQTFQVSDMILEATIRSDAIRIGKFPINRYYLVCILPWPGRYNVYIYSFDSENKFNNCRHDSVEYQSIPSSVEAWTERIGQIPEIKIQPVIKGKIVGAISGFRLFSGIPSPGPALEAHSVDGPELFMTVFEHHRIFNVRLSFNVEEDRKIIEDIISISQKNTDSSSLNHKLEIK
jgi:hypothetical protein